MDHIEQGDPGCSIGAVFEVAAIVGFRLFDAEQVTFQANIANNATILFYFRRVCVDQRRSCG